MDGWNSDSCDAISGGNSNSSEKSVADAQNEFVKHKAFDPKMGFDVHQLPIGSVVTHHNNLTKVYSPRGEELFSIDDTTVGEIYTPVGPIKSTRIFRVPSGSYVMVSGSVTRVYLNGTCILTVKDYDTYTIPDFDGWIEDAYNWSINYLDLFEAYWDVPSSPPSPNPYAVNFLFNAIEPTDYSAIVQPVLEWNWGGSGRWTAKAWAVDQNGNTYTSDPINVDVGDQLKGTLLWQDDYAFPISDCWYIEITDCTTDQKTYLYSNAVGRDFNLGVFVALEGYNIEDDGDVPGNTTFYNIVFKDNNLNPVYFQWNEWIDSTATNYLTGLDVVTYWFDNSLVSLKTAN